MRWNLPNFVFHKISSLTAGPCHYWKHRKYSKKYPSLAGLNFKLSASMAMHIWNIIHLIIVSGWQRSNLRFCVHLDWKRLVAENNCPDIKSMKCCKNLTCRAALELSISNNYILNYGLFRSYYSCAYLLWNSVYYPDLKEAKSWNIIRVIVGEYLKRRE
jgi:hypothetical protein